MREFSILVDVSDECHTAVSILDLLSPHLRDLEQLNRLLTNGVQGVDRQISMAERSILLLMEAHSLLSEVEIIADVQSQVSGFCAM